MDRNSISETHATRIGNSFLKKENSFRQAMKQRVLTLKAKHLSGGLNSSKIVLKFLSLESVVLAGKRNAVYVRSALDSKCMLSAW